MKKPGGLLLSIGLGGKGKKGDDDEAEGEEKEGTREAAQAILDAIADKDAGALEEALHAFLYACEEG